MEAVRRHSTPDAPWIAASVSPGSLESPVDVVEIMVDAAKRESDRLRHMASGAVTRRALDDLLGLGKKLYREFSERGGGAFGLSAGGRRDEGLTAGRAFRNAAPLLSQFHIVVCVDEAQNTPVSGMTRDVMNCLHRDPQGIPLVAAFFGLSDTRDVLRRCGLSRFADERVVNLEPLSHEDAVCAIWSAFEAYGFTGTPENRAAWVDSLAALSQGWPQHINRVAVVAARMIRDHGGRIEERLLDEALARGRERKDAYCADRLAAGSRPPWIYRQMTALAREKGGALTYDDLRNFAGKDTLDDFLDNALHAGLLAPVKNLPRHYHIAVPSLGDYLRALPVEPPQP